MTVPHIHPVLPGLLSGSLVPVLCTVNSAASDRLACSSPYSLWRGVNDSAESVSPEKLLGGGSVHFEMWQFFFLSLCFSWSLLYLFFLKFIYFNWRLITLQYCSSFAIHWHESAMGVHVFHPEPASHLPPHPIPLGHPSVPAPITLSHALNLD